MKFAIQVLQILLLVSIIEGNFFDTIFGGLKTRYQSSASKSSKISLGKSSGKVSETISLSSSAKSSDKSTCERPLYRPYDGYGNNLKNPTWGTPNTQYKRMFCNYSYADGLCEMADLPNPRTISLQGFVHLAGTEDPEWTLNLVVWGQFIAHDTAHTYGVPETGEMNNLCSCINGKIVGNSTKCPYILIPEDDPYNAPEGKECLSFIRTKSTCLTDPTKPAEQINEVNSYLDASFTYGKDAAGAKNLRSLKNGMLLSQTRKGRMYPPQSLKINKCYGYSGTIDKLCLHTGDSRANQSPYISFVHILLLRYHNNIAQKLIEINPKWDDETCYQETRRIVIATIQHISIDGFLPILVGKKNMKKKKAFSSINILTPYDNVYDENVDPSALNEMATAAFRVLHSSIQGFMRLYTQDREECGRLRLSDYYDDASVFLKGNTEIGLATGFSTQHQWKIDRYHDDEINENLFRYASATGSDLFALDLQRSRDHGLASYVVALVQCGLSNPKSFDDFEKYMSKESVELLKRLYPNYLQVEIRVGGNLEYPLPYGLVGPTFNCIILEQFDKLKRGDYYWYENGKQHCPFTKDQLKSIKKGSTISSLICNQIDGMKKMQKDGFQKINALYNPLVDCEDIPTIDLNLWKDNSAN